MGKQSRVSRDVHEDKRRHDKHVEADAPDEVEQTEAAEPRDFDSDVDAILEEIDGVLEENAQEFVAGYVQKGGQ